jgi:hypothetical protein
MEEQYYADRSHLRTLLRTEPTWSNHAYAEAVGRSLSWVKKWKKRLREADPADEQVLVSQSRRAQHRRAPIHPVVVKRLLELRDELPATLGRVAGPKTLRYYLQEDEGLRESGHPLPRSTSTIHALLVAHGRIARPLKTTARPWPERLALHYWQLDFKDVSTVLAEPEGKRQHVVESLNVVDEGTSLVMSATVRDDFTMETALETLIQALERRGVPQQVTFDRDPRFVGSWSGQDFPTPFVRFPSQRACRWLTIGVKVVVCPPRRPDRNGFVERYHRSYNEECLQKHRPTDLTQAQAVTARYVEFYNHQRPHQGRSCHNRPPSRALAEADLLPPVLRRLPATIHPNIWLFAIHGRSYTRRVSARGTVDLDGQRYYIRTALAKQTVNLEIDAPKREIIVRQAEQIIRRLPIRGLHPTTLDWATYRQTIVQEAHRHWSSFTYHQRQRRRTA